MIAIVFQHKIKHQITEVTLFSFNTDSVIVFADKLKVVVRQHFSQAGQILMNGGPAYI